MNPEAREEHARCFWDNYYFKDDPAGQDEEGEGEEEEDEEEEERPAWREGLRELRGGDFDARQSALELVQGKGRALALLDERFSRDPDVVLLAVGCCAEALQFASPDLRSDADFALEAVQWNWRALEFLPDTFRCDRTIVRAAARQSLDAIGLADESLRDDRHLAGEARAGALAGLPFCEDESLRLVGPCNAWRMTDSMLRFRRVPSPTRGAVRHKLVVHLGWGCLGFQVVSCIWQSAVRIFPLKGGDKTHYKLVRGDASSIVATMGGEEEGEADYFYIDEGAGAVVSIYVELSSGAPSGHGRAPAAPRALLAGGGQLRGFRRRSAVRRRVSVWYCREKDDFSAPEGIVTLVQPRDVDCGKSSSSARTKPRGAKATQTEVLVDVETRADMQKLISQAQALSESAFPQQFTLEDLQGHLHLTILVDISLGEMLGYCLYRVEDEEQALWIEQVAVAESRRGCGLGRDLLSWATKRAGDSGCSRVRLNSRNRALGFYLQLGFEALPDATSIGCRTLELRLTAGE